MAWRIPLISSRGEGPALGPGNSRTDLTINVSRAAVEQASRREDKQEAIDVDNSSILYNGLSKKQTVLLTHGDAVTRVAPAFRATGWTEEGHVVSLENEERRLYGVQFHPEVDLSTDGIRMVKNFLFSVAKLSGTYTPKSRHQARHTPQKNLLHHGRLPQHSADVGPLA